jgi:antitoxin HicB
MNTNSFQYSVIFQPEGDAINVTVPDIPEAITCGYSEAEATEYAIDAIETVLGEYIRRKRDIPTPARRKGVHVRTVTLPALTQAKLALYSELRAEGIRKADLARRLGWSKNQVERLLDLNHASRIDQIEAALSAIGKKISIRISDAA